MNDIQANHLRKILNTTERLLSDKYIKGTKEHDSNLSEDYSASQILDMAIEEAIDQVTYLLTLREKVDDTSNT